jgi:predicted hydrolase (HD superfamily)
VGICSDARRKSTKIHKDVSAGRDLVLFNIHLRSSKEITSFCLTLASLLSSLSQHTENIEEELTLRGEGMKSSEG